MAFDRKKFIAKFIVESREHITQINGFLVHLESHPADVEALNNVFRAAHTIKGLTGVLDLKAINQLSHKLEDVLDSLRQQRIAAGKPLFTLLFQTVDALALLIDGLSKGQETNLPDEKLVEALALAAQGKWTGAAPAAPLVEAPPAPMPAAFAPATAPSSAASAPMPAAASAEDGAESKKKGAPVAPPEETFRIHAHKVDETIKLAGEITSVFNRVKQGFTDFEKMLQVDDRCFDLFARIEAGEASPGGGHLAELSARFHVFRSDLKKYYMDTRDLISIWELLSGDMRDRVLKMRMLPLSTATAGLPRLARDVATKLGKSVELAITGGATELDKKIIEKMEECLVHLVRNCIDHGIETPEERRLAGKPEKGTVSLSAGYDGGSALIVISDDGAGISTGKIKERALRRKLYDETAINGMSHEELINLIFLPGFSTSSIITDVSGRGVGMDVVRENIVHQLKGSIQLETEAGKGTRFIIRLPLTLAIVRVLLVEAAAQAFAFNQSAIREILKIQRTEIIQVVNRHAIRLREQIVPIVELRELLGLPGASASQDATVILLAVGGEKLGIIIDQLLGEENLELKPLPPHLQNIEVIAGASGFGKDDLVFLLHAPALIDLFRSLSHHAPSAAEAGDEIKTRAILVVDDSINTREIEKSILESYGYRVDTAGDGMEGLEKARKKIYDLVITDVEMPRLDGFSLTERLRQEDAYKHVPIIILTSREREEDKRRGIQVGANAYLVKGNFEQSNLIATVQSLIL